MNKIIKVLISYFCKPKKEVVRPTALSDKYRNEVWSRNKNINLKNLIQ